MEETVKKREKVVDNVFSKLKKSGVPYAICDANTTLKGVPSIKREEDWFVIVLFNSRNKLKKRQIGGFGSCYNDDMILERTLLDHEVRLFKTQLKVKHRLVVQSSEGKVYEPNGHGLKMFYDKEKNQK